jgi:hypothetical protein
MQRSDGTDALKRTSEGEVRHDPQQEGILPRIEGGASALAA